VDSLQKRLLIILAFVILAFTCGWLLVERFMNDAEDGDDLAHTSIDNFISRLTESGLANRPIDYNDPLLKERTIVITQEINEQISREVCAKLLYLNQLDRKRPITLLIKTLGGWQDDAFIIIDVMQKIEAPVDTWALGSCYSSGAMILAGGTGVRRAMPQALIMLHVNEGDGNKAYSWESQSRKRFEEFWKRRARLPKRFFPMDSEQEYYLTPAEALKYGVIDEVVAGKAK
jgi:ATP-dependent Clp protease protease subunit